MKTRFLKSLLNIAPVILIALALMELYRANMELQYKYDSLEWRINDKYEQLDLVNATLWQRTSHHRPESSKVAQ